MPWVSQSIVLASGPDLCLGYIAIFNLTSGQIVCVLGSFLPVREWPKPGGRPHSFRCLLSSGYPCMVGMFCLPFLLLLSLVR